MRPQPFNYALEPLRQQAAWQLDAVLAELAASARKLMALQKSAQAHERHVAALLSWMKPPSSSILDPLVARNRLAYLAQAAEKTAAFQHDIGQAEEEIRRLQECCQDKQLKLDAIERHRQDTEQDHRQSQAQKGSAQADDDWLVRSSWAARQRTSGVAEKDEST